MVTADSVTVSLVVSPDATVYINNNDYSAKLGDDGRLSIDIPLTSAGDNIFAIDVIQPGRQAVKDSFTVTAQAEKTRLVPEAEYLRTYTDAFECRGTTEPGATLSAALNGKIFTGLVADSGAYSAACTAAEYGLYSVTLTASSAGKDDSTVSISAERLPEPGVFKSGAQKKTAADVAKNAPKLMGVGIQLTGKPGTVTPDGPAQRFDLAAGGSSLSCYYYGGTPQLSSGQSYTFYGMVDETGGFYVMFAE
jgi:hypothetical protein